MNTKDFMVGNGWVVTKHDNEPLKTTIGDTLDIAIPGGYAEMQGYVAAIDEYGMEIDWYGGTFHANFICADEDPTILEIGPGRKWSHQRTVHLDFDKVFLKLTLAKEDEEEEDE